MTTLGGTSPIWPASAPAPASFAVVPVPPLEHPKQVGAYRIDSVLGEGGMGTVYSAEQLEPVQRRVALKLIKLGMDTREVIARFQSERQTLAVMDHPNIARVFDAGATESGRPYFVMEFVEGVPLTAYCDQHALPTARRLELFAQVCDAVQHAHTKGVIHRDIKPGNVLVCEVDGKPIPKVIDFGVAKAVDHRAVGRTVFTELGAMVGTPEYMSPEQAQPLSEDIDARTDVYSLGVVLYELLSGALPFDPKTLRSHAYNEIQRIIREVEPPRPSTRVLRLEQKQATDLAVTRGETVATLSASLRRELEWIPLKAMRKDREMRYRTAHELADDVRNYLAGKPLLAGPESGVYRARKFLRRNRAAVAIATTMLLLLVGGVVATTYQAVRATRAEHVAQREKNEADLQRAAAQRRFDDVRALARRLLFELHPEIDRLAGSTPAVRKIVDMSLEYLSKLQAESSDDAKLIQDVAGAYHRLGDIQGNPNTNNVGDVAGAAASYERAQLMAQRAAALWPNHTSPQNLLAISDLKIGDLLDRQGKREEAMKHFQAASVLFARAAAAAPPNDFVAGANLLIAPQRISEHRLQMGDVEGALAASSQGLQAAREAVARQPNDRRSDLLVTSALEHLARAQKRAGRFNDANETYRQKIERLEALTASKPDDAAVRQSLAESLLSVANLQMTEFEDFDGAGRNVSRAVELSQAMFDADPANRYVLNGLGRALMAQMDLLRHAGKHDEARRSIERAVVLWSKGLELTPSDRFAKQNLIVSYGQLGDLLDVQGDSTAALAARRKGMDVLRPMLDADPANALLQSGLAFAQWQTANTLHKLGDEPAAREEARGAMTIFERLAAKNPADLRNLENLIRAQRTLINALTAIAGDERTSPDQRRALRAEARELLLKVRDGYDEFPRRGSSLNPEFVEHRKTLDQSLSELQDGFGLATQRTEPTTVPATQPHS